MPYRRESPIHLVNHLLRAYRRYGVRPDAALAEAQIDPALLADPAARITSRQLELMTQRTMRELDDECMGMYSRRVPWGSFEMLLRACMTAQDLGVALQQWCRFRSVLIPDVEVVLHVEQGEARLSIHEHQPLGEARDFALLSILRHAHGAASWLIDQPLPLTGVAFPGPAPLHHRALSVMFPGPVAHDAARASLGFAAGYLALPVRRDEPGSGAVLQHASRLAIKGYRKDRQLAPRVRALLASQPGEGLTAEQVAIALHVSVRSLHRRLAEEGVRLQRLKDDVRRVRALELLAHRDLPAKRIASMLAFSSEQSLARAFERWTGMSLHAWRERNRGPAPRP